MEQPTAPSFCSSARRWRRPKRVAATSQARIGETFGVPVTQTGANWSKPDSPEKRAVDDLIDADRAVLIGPILAEVLLGFRRKAQADWVASPLRAAHLFEAAWDDCKLAAEIGRELATKGHTFPMTDLDDNRNLSSGATFADT